MKLIIDRITATPERQEFEADPSFWREAGEAFAEFAEEKAEETAAPMCFELSAYRMGEDLLLEGVAKGALTLECSRCLTRYSEAVEEPFRVILEPAGDRVPAEPEAALALAQNGICLGDELETGWYHGTLIELAAFFRELVVLALPAKPLCREECRGLCPQCGADRNTQTCTCEKVNPTSPFAVLEKLRDAVARHEKE